MGQTYTAEVVPAEHFYWKWRAIVKNAAGQVVFREDHHTKAHARKVANVEVRKRRTADA